MCFVCCLFDRSITIDLSPVERPAFREVFGNGNGELGVSRKDGKKIDLVSFSYGVVDRHDTSF